LNTFSNFAFNAASILISGGQARLKPSPGSFFLASMPGLLPLAISDAHEGGAAEREAEP